MVNKQDSPPTRRPVAVITGATGGMGLAIVAEMASMFDVIAVGRRRSALDELAAQTACRTLALDVTDPQAPAAIAASAGPHVGVVVHAAALGTPLSLEEAGGDDWTAQFAVNVIAPALITRALLPALRRSEGTVVFIGSGAGTRPVPRNCVYTATKHALKGLADVLRMDEAEHRIRVVTVAPGHTDTPMLRSSLERTGRGYEPDRYIRPGSIAAAVRQVVSTSPDVHITDVWLRPRVEVAGSRPT